MFGAHAKGKKNGSAAGQSYFCGWFGGFESALSSGGSGFKVTTLFPSLIMIISPRKAFVKSCWSRPSASSTGKIFTPKFYFLRKGRASSASPSVPEFGV